MEPPIWRSWAGQSHVCSCATESTQQSTQNKKKHFGSPLLGTPAELSSFIASSTTKRFGDLGGWFQGAIARTEGVPDLRLRWLMTLRCQLFTVIHMFLCQSYLPMAPLLGQVRTLQRPSPSLHVPSKKCSRPSLEPKKKISIWDDRLIVSHLGQSR